MKFYSEYTKKFYDTMEECAKVDNEYLESLNRKKNAENEAKAKMEELYANFNAKNDAVKKANAELVAASKEIQRAVSAFSSKYGYVPDKFRSIQFLTWLL